MSERGQHNKQGDLHWSPDLCLDSELHKQVFHPGGVHLLAVIFSSRPFILFISRPSLQFPMVLCLCELWPVSWYCWRNDLKVAVIWSNSFSQWSRTRTVDGTDTHWLSSCERKHRCAFKCGKQHCCRYKTWPFFFFKYAIIQKHLRQKGVQTQFYMQLFYFPFIFPTNLTLCCKCIVMDRGKKTALH